ncbi:MAG: ATP-binding cassette domain-containing protein [Gammaproteobacteria bacterium]|nr:ATP-binding cassette domain-containing protein [Gammaproteobacteria bacterium]
MSSLISVNNLTRRYGDFCAVDNISFELKTGDILGFLGPNGAGKTSTMQMLTGNLAPTLGEISINGVDLLEHPKTAKASIGYLPENPPLYKEMTVTEYLQYCGRLHLISKSQLSKVCDSAIERCGLGDVKQRLIRNLSKGYQQRVGIAQAILHSPPVIILDEPTVGLDPIQILEIRQLMQTLGESHGIILCTHILPEVQAVCNRVQIINCGELVYSSSIDELLDTENKKFEITLSSMANRDELARHDVFNSVEITGENSFLAESDLSADKLIEYIVKQQWGLTRFTTHEVSLEQIFIDLTTGEANVNTDPKTSTSDTPA